MPDWKAITDLPFVQVALPILLGLLLVNWYNNRNFEGIHKRIDDLRADMNRGFDRVDKRLEKIETKLDTHERDLSELRERTSPFRRN